MGKINVLDFEIANLIAAGEVVDRPSSVLKELLENAIDAGAKHITAEISRGGVRSIRVTDDGCGMSPEDMPVALRRHATSKIKEASDLDGILTLGFRGEALAAISSVSTVTIISKTADAETGTMLVSEGGTVTDLSEVGARDGTTVLVENLFARVPARRKFLKKDATETMACTAQMEKVAMSHPELSFRFVTDGTLKFHTVGDGDVKNVLYALYGRDFASRLLAVSCEMEGVTVSGYVGRSDNAHGNRNMQNVFINGRYVKSKTVSAALERAFTSYMAPERFPVSALYLTIDPRLVDVNVHPAKLEVRFSDERKIFEAVYWGVRGALEENTARPEMPLNNPYRTAKAVSGFTPVGGAPRVTQLEMPPSPPSPAKAGTSTLPREPISGYKETLSPSASLDLLGKIKQSMSETVESEYRFPGEYAEPKVVSPPDFSTPRKDNGIQTITEDLQISNVKIPQETEEKKESLHALEAAPPAGIPSYRFIGVAFRCYLLVEVGEELLVIDQHAAHERILFEDMLAKQKSGGRVASQGLLISVDISLTPEEIAVAEDAKDELAAVGFEFDVNADTRMVALRAIPDALDTTDARDLFVRMIGEVLDGRGNPVNTEAERREKTLYQIACKAAIKGGRTYGDAQLTWLVERVLALADVTVCPHGRPIAYRLTKKELDKQFDRIK